MKLRGLYTQGGVARERGKYRFQFVSGKVAIEVLFVPPSLLSSHSRDSTLESGSNEASEIYG